MKDYWLWIGGTMIFLNFANFLYAEFRISVMSIAKQRLWAFYVMLTLMFEAFIGVLSVFELLSERPDKYLWLITGGASVVFFVLFDNRFASAVCQGPGRRRLYI